MSYSNTEFLHRISEKDPLITFRIEFETTEHFTVVTEKGSGVSGVIIETISLMGGLFTSVFAFTTIVVGFLTKPGFTAYMSKNLFTVTKYDPEYE